MNKIIDLCKKLNALAKQGVGGEKHNAAQMLQKLLEKHGITLDEIQENEMRAFKFVPRNKKLFANVAASVVGAEYNMYSYRGQKGIWMDLFPNQYLEIEAKYAFYQRAYNQELKRMVRAFIMRNDLYPQDGGTEQRELTSKELEELLQIYEMSKGLDRHHYNKQISHTST